MTIEFQEGITCIVGPNGSGKSNIADGLRWVLGEQSPKALRGGRMDEVIFAGTATRKPKGMAEVTLVIDNAAGILPIDFAEVAIRRRMYRSGESEYFINDTRCRLRDVRELIMDTGIGVDGYSIISQGKISEIVSSKPENRRELFEEAAGITRYRSKKAEAESKLDSATANLERVDDIISEIESRMDGLRADSEKAKEFLVLRDRHKELEINITLREIENAEKTGEQADDELNAFTERLSRLREEKAAGDAAAAAGRQRSDAFETEGNAIRDRIVANMNETNEIRSRAELNEEKKQTLARDEKRLAGEADLLDARAGKERENLAAVSAGAAETDAKLEKLRAKLAESAKAASARSEDLARLAREADARRNDIFDLHRRRVAEESEMASVRNLRETLERRREQLTEESAQSGAGGRETEAAIESAERRIAALGEKVTTLSRTRAETETNRAALSKKAAALAERLSGIRILREQVSARKKTIEEMESNYEGYNQGVRAVMKAGLAGLRGTVAELTETPPGFEVAIETALGAAMQNIVCEDDESAKAAIAYLKERKAGRLTFLPIKSIKPSGGARDETLVSAPGSLGYASDRVRFDASLGAVFDYLLGRVLIVDTLDNAVRVSKRARSGLRFVTLEGEVINSAGAMTGGSYRNKSANLLERRAETARLAARLDELERERATLAEEETRLGDEAEGLTARLGDTERALREAELEQASAHSEIRNLTAQRDEFADRLKKWEHEIAGIDSERAHSRDVTDALEAKIARLAEAEAEAEAAVLAATARHEEEKTLLDAENEAITQLRIEEAEAANEKSNVDQMIRRVADGLAEIERDMRARAEELERTRTQREALSSDGTDADAQLGLKDAERAELEARLETTLRNRAEAVREADALAKRKDELEARIETEQSGKYDAEIKKAKSDARLENLKDKLWEEFEVSYIQAAEFRKREFVMGAAVKESREIKGRMRELGEVNVGAIREYETVSERYAFLTEQRADLTNASDALKKIIDDMDKTIRENFKESFDKVVDNFGETFRRLFGGGNGELRLEDENRPLECGIEINVQPPGKKLRNMNLLSGGEKTMTAIALMFSILKAKPTPFCILDEVEAALDERNINRFAEYLETFKGTQFALVTHQKATMEYADALYGVTMPEEGITKVLSLRLGEAETEAFAESL